MSFTEELKKELYALGVEIHFARQSLSTLKASEVAVWIDHIEFLIEKIEEREKIEQAPKA